MPTPPDFKPNPLLPEYFWDEEKLQYINRNTGRPLAHDEISFQLEKVINKSSEEMRAISQQLRDGEISLADWQIAMMALITIVHLAGAVMQRGGWQQMTPAAFEIVGRIIRKEYGFLRNFANDIASGKVKLDGRILGRAAQYARAGRETFLAFWSETVKNRGFDEERSILNPAEHCQTCVNQAALGFQKLGDMIPIGSRQCRANDKCDVQLRNSVTGETIRI